MIITVGDSWKAKADTSRPLKMGESVSDMPDKEELIMVVGMARNGKVITLSIPYEREFDKIRFKIQEEMEMQPLFLNPVKKIFEKLRKR